MISLFWSRTSALCPESGIQFTAYEKLPETWLKGGKIKNPGFR
jgi:hypothetical protein